MCITILITILSLLVWSLTEADVDTETTVYLEELPKPNEADYRLGPGDVVNIAVDSVPELSLKYTISETGNIMFPTLLSPLKAQGLTLEQLQILLVNLLTEYMYEPKVMVDIVEYQSHKVLVLGPFQKPGSYQLKRERVPLLDIILEAGGLRELKDNDEMVILRNPDSSNSYKVDPGNGENPPYPFCSSFFQKLDSEPSGMQSIRVNLQGLLRDGDLAQNVMVQAGDLIYLTSFFAADQYIYVAGGGRRGAGTIPYEPGLTAFKALLRAGVVLDDPQALDLMIVRGQASSERFITTRVKFDHENPSVGDVVLSPEDIVILPEVSSQMVYVAGKVNKPGALPFQEGLTVLQAVLDAGGMNKEAVGSKVKILREDAIQAFGKSLSKRGMGDSPHGQKQIPVDMDAILEKGDKSQNELLAQGDIIVVPGMSPQADITVTGKVNSPGIVPYEELMTAMKAVFLAGGLSGNMLTSQIRIMSSNGDIQPPFMLDISKAQLEQAVLKPGDLVVVMGPAPGNLISVLGKVRRPGVIDYEDGLTALQAILRAGGFDQGAARSKVRIVRGEGENQQKLRANLESLMDKGDQSGNIALLPGDIVIVPETFF